MTQMTAEELESQLAEAEENMRAAADQLDFVSAEKFRKVKMPSNLGRS